MSEPAEGMIHWNEDGVYWVGQRIKVDLHAALADVTRQVSPHVLYWLPVPRFRRPGRSPFRRRRRGRA